MAPAQREGPALLHLYSGSPEDPQSVCGFLRRAGWSAVGLDWANPFGKESQDLGSDGVWGRVLRDVGSGRYDFVFLTPPAGTFRAPPAGGELPSLRTEEHPYGRPRAQVPQDEHEAIRIATYHILQCLRAARAALSVGTGFALAGPASHAAPSLAVPFGILPEARALALEPRVCALALAEAPGDVPAPTGLMYFGPELSALRGRSLRDPAGAGKPSGRRTAPALAKEIAWAVASRGRRSLPALSGAAEGGP